MRWWRGLAGSVTVLALTLIAGSWTAIGQFLGGRSEVLLPAALGLPVGIPALSVLPQRAALAYWVTDALAAVLLVAWVLVWSAQLRRHRFWFVISTVISGLAGVNLLRLIVWSFTTQHQVSWFLVSAAVTALISAVVGLGTGLLTATLDAAALAAGRFTAARVARARTARQARSTPTGYREPNPPAG